MLFRPPTPLKQTTLINAVNTTRHDNDSIYYPIKVEVLITLCSFIGDHIGLEVVDCFEELYE